IDVAAHDVQRRERAQRLEQLGTADVARMDDQIGPAQRIKRLRAQEPVRVGDDADEKVAHERTRSFPPVGFYDEWRRPALPCRPGRPGFELGAQFVIWATNSVSLPCPQSPASPRAPSPTPAQTRPRS